MRALVTGGLVIGFVYLAAAVPRPPDIPFEKHRIDPGASETCAWADINGDSRLDLVSGEYWYEAPRWTKRRFRNLDYTNSYIDDFSDLPVDVNGDGRVDIVSCSWFGQQLRWFENFGRTCAAWREHTIERGHNVEFAFLVDIDNDGHAREVLPDSGTPTLRSRGMRFATAALCGMSSASAVTGTASARAT